MYVWTGGHTGYSRAKRQERDAGVLQKTYQRAAFRAVGMKTYVYRIAVVVTQSIMRWALADGRQG